MWDLQNEHTVAFYAAQYEAEQAERDTREAHDAYRDTNYRSGSAEDYALWSACGYLNATEKLVRDLSVWEA